MPHSFILQDALSRRTLFSVVPFNRHSLSQLYSTYLSTVTSSLLRQCSSNHTASCFSVPAGGELLAVGSQNGSVYLYRSTKDGYVYTRSGKMAGGQPLSTIDWSTSGRYLQTLTADYDVVYC